MVSEHCYRASAALLPLTPVTGLGGWRGRSQEWIPLTELPPSCLCYIILLIHCLDFFLFFPDQHVHTYKHALLKYSVLYLIFFYAVDGWIIFRNCLGPGRNAVKHFVCLSPLLVQLLCTRGFTDSICITHCVQFSQPHIFPTCITLVCDRSVCESFSLQNNHSPL